MCLFFFFSNFFFSTRLDSFVTIHPWAFLLLYIFENSSYNKFLKKKLIKLNEIIKKWAFNKKNVTTAHNTWSTWLILRSNVILRTNVKSAFEYMGKCCVENIHYCIHILLNVYFRVHQGCNNNNIVLMMQIAWSIRYCLWFFLSRFQGERVGI